MCFPERNGGLYPAAHFWVFWIYVYINNAMPIQYLPKTFSNISPLGGDTPFCAFGYEIIDFYLTRKKTGRRYGLRLFNYIFIIVYASVRDVAWRHTLWRKEQRCPHAIYHARAIYKPTNNAVPIKYRNQNPNKIFKFIHHCRFSKIFSHPFSFLATIHLFARSVTKSKISTSPAKKLVAATGGVFNFLHLINTVICPEFSMRNA